jgi:hypothetical protein
MALSGLIGVSIMLAGFVAALLVGAVRLVVARWCPACDGAGVLAGSRRHGASCDICNGSGRLRIPDRPPKEWFTPSTDA